VSEWYVMLDEDCWILVHHQDFFDVTVVQVSSRENICLTSSASD